jgi:hypothetical protein
MKAIGGYLLGAVVLALASAVCLAVGLLDRDMAEAERRAVVADYRELTGVLDRAERYYEYASRLPWIGPAPLNDVRARKAALQYWERRYAALLPNPADPLASIPPENVDLQFLVASAVYRQGAAGAKDRPAMVAALDAGIGAYLTVLKNATRHDAAAFNYEYLLRVRDEIDKNRRKTAAPPEPSGPHGSSGAPQEQTDTSPFKVYVPLDSGERNKTDGEAGRAEPIKRKG